jgi:hypothetical protein
MSHLDWGVYNKDVRKFSSPEANTPPITNMVLDRTGAGLRPRIDGFFA